MKSFLAKPPVLWFLFLFNAVVAVVLPFAVDGLQGLVSAAIMGAVSLGAGAALLTTSRSGRAARPTDWSRS